MATAITDSITTIDGHYQYPGRAAAYLIQDGAEAAFIDNVTRFSVPYLLEALAAKGLEPAQVRYLIVTHIHLDHSGGTAELALQCPNAKIVCHPRAARHIVDPTKLVASVKSFYGDEAFDRLYGEIGPVEERRVQSVEDGETLALGGRTLTFLDTPGHARHHIAIQDSATNSMFAGDAFGLCYPGLQKGHRPYLNYVCAPPQFDPAAAKDTIRRIVETGVDRVFVTHFGQCDAVQEGAEQLIACLDLYDALVNDVAEREVEGDALHKECSERAQTIMQDQLTTCGLDPEDPAVQKWAGAEHALTSQGLALLAEQRRKQRGSDS